MPPGPYRELLAGNGEPEELSDDLKQLCICDTGCGTSMPNRPGQCRRESIYNSDSLIEGAGGQLTIKQKGYLSLPMQTNRGLARFTEADAILNDRCAYVLLAIGRASKQQGVTLVMPPWGADGYFEYPNGVRVTLLNRHVLLLRPLGYKQNPEVLLAAQDAITLESLGVPVDGEYGMYIGANDDWPGDLRSQLIGTIRVVPIDKKRGGVLHDITSALVTSKLIDAASTGRCRFVYSSVDCRSWSAAQWLPDARGQPGNAPRDVDHILGRPGVDGTLPPSVVDGNAQARASAAICRAVVVHGGFYVAETPVCRREGQPDATPGCEKHVSMFDHYAWVMLAQETNASLVLHDQCRFLDDEAHAVTTGPKATSLLASDVAAPHVQAVLGDKRCMHRHGTHRALRGTVGNTTTYATVGSERYSARYCAALALAIRRTIADGRPQQPAEVSALVAGVLHGKRLPRHSVDARFFHDIFNHSEHRVLQNIHHAIGDAEEWWADVIRNNNNTPCEACLRAEAPKLGPTGKLPQDKGLGFLDIWHCNVPSITNGNRIRIGFKLADDSKFFKSVGLARKSEAPDAFLLILAFLASLGVVITWIHTDCAPELKSGGLGKIAKEGKMRVTTNVPGTSRANGIEPIFRVGRKVVATLLERARLPLAFHEYAWAYFEQGHALRPSRGPPHDCSLGRLLARVDEKLKATAAWRRPFGCLSYATIAKRLPNGTLVNKLSAQAVRCLHLGYVGDRGGAYETLGYDRAKPGYICYEPESNEMIVTESVRFIPGCFPGLQRSAGGGWKIPADRIPFSAESLQAKQLEPHAEQAEPQQHSHIDQDEPIDIDIDSDPVVVDSDFDYDTLNYKRGFPEDNITETAQAPTPPANTSPPEPAQAPTDAPRERQLVPREMWPDYSCTEHNGKGWEVEITETSKDKRYGRCRFIKNTDPNGRPFFSEWIELARLLPLGTTEDPAASSPTAPPTEAATAPPPPPPPTTLPDPFMVPNSNTVPHRPGASPLEEPTRPQRVRIEPTRFEPTMLSAQYLGGPTGLDSNSMRGSMYIDLDGMGERFAGLVVKGAPDDMTNNTLADGSTRATSSLPNDVHAAFMASPVEVQRALCVMADHAELSDAFGHNAPPTVAAREWYAAANVAAACAGHQLPPLEALITVSRAIKDPDDLSMARGTTEQLTLSEIFEDEHDGSIINAMLPSAMLATLVFLAKKRTSPDIFGEKEMSGPEWDEPKSVEVATLDKMNAMTRCAADDPRIKGRRIVDTMWTGRVKREADRTFKSRKGRCVLRGDLHKAHYKVSDNQATAPVVRSTSAMVSDAISAIRQRHSISGDVPSAYIQGEQKASEQVVARPPVGFREYDERGVEVYWLMNVPLYGQVDAGSIWNRTLNDFVENGPDVPIVDSSTHAADITTADEIPIDLLSKTPAGLATKQADGLGMTRCAYDPCVYTSVTGPDEGTNLLVYVDDVRLNWDTDKAACAKAIEQQTMLKKKFNIMFGEVDPDEDYFLGANRAVNKARDVVIVRATTYIDSMHERYCDGDAANSSQRFPASWSHTPADDELVRAYEAASETRAPAESKLFAEYNSLVGSLRHAVKYRPGIAAAMDLLDCCLTSPTEQLLRCAYRVLVYLVRTRRMGTCFSGRGDGAAKITALADANWRSKRSTTGYCIFLANACAGSCCRRQSGLSMSSTESELTALAELAIELLVFIGIAEAHGMAIDYAVECSSDNKGAYDLCHRFTSAQHSRHIDRKLYKMREMRGAGRVTVKYVPTDDNTADISTKILSRQPFEKHRRTLLNLAAMPQT